MNLFKLILFLIILVSSSCEDTQENKYRVKRKRNQIIERITRKNLDKKFESPPSRPRHRPRYPWGSKKSGNQPRITKEFFRCKGSILNPPIQTHDDVGNALIFLDCGGMDMHSLPIHNEKEFIYPVLIDILNYIQEQTNNKVVITSGHRCPQHNTYADNSSQNKISKHMIGAEVNFYVKNMEQSPEKITELIQSYFLVHPTHRNEKEYIEFKRYQSGGANVSTLPWYNKEVFIKLFKKHEGRDFDNQHSYPYMSIQVRFDPKENKLVGYTWAKAHREYLRW